MKNKGRLISCILMIGIGLIAAALIAVSQFHASDPKNTIFADYYNSIGWENAPGEAQRVCMAISDGLMVVGVMLAGVGLLAWISTTGFFDMLSYGFSSLKVLVMPFARQKARPRFYDYKVAKQEKRKERPMHILCVGLGFLAASGVFAALYYLF